MLRCLPWSRLLPSRRKDCYRPRHPPAEGFAQLVQLAESVDLSLQSHRPLSEAPFLMGSGVVSRKDFPWDVWRYEIVGRRTPGGTGLNSVTRWTGSATVFLDITQAVNPPLRAQSQSQYTARPKSLTI